MIAGAPEFVWPQIGEEDIAGVEKMLRDREISYVGRHGQVRRLEEQFCAYYGVRHALAVNSGTSALHSAYFAIGLEAGDEVLVPTYTFLATITPVLSLNAVPVLVDCDEWTGNIDPARLEAAVTPRTKAIAVTHLNGYPVDMPKVMAVARRHGLKVVEDCSHSHGAVCAGQKIGTWGDAAAFSVQAKKLVTGGEGGLLLTQDTEVFERAVLLGHFRDRSYDDVTDPALRPYVATGFGFNYRMNPLSAHLASNSMDRLERTISGRETNFRHFDTLLKGVPGIRPAEPEPHMDRVSYYSYQPHYLPEELDGLPIEIYIEAVAAEGVPVTRPKSPPLHCEPAFQCDRPVLGAFHHYGQQGASYRTYAPGALPQSEAYVRHALRFPAYTDDVRDDLDRFADAMAKVAEHAPELRRLAGDHDPDEFLARIASVDGRYIEPPAPREGAR